MQNLTLALVQSDIYWENSAANLAMFEEKLWAMDQKVDIIVLPEIRQPGRTNESSQHQMANSNGRSVEIHCYRQCHYKRERQLLQPLALGNSRWGAVAL